MKCRLKNTLINYEVFGSGKPVLMIHGYAADHKLMEGCMEPVFHNKNYRRIYIDLPGMGESGILPNMKNSDDMLDVIVDFINNIIPDTRFLLAGESYGGYLSRGIIYRMGDMIDGLLLVCPVVIPEIKERNLPEHAVVFKDYELLSELGEKEAKNFNAVLVTQNRKIYNRYVNEVISGIREERMNYLKKFKRTGYGFSFDVDKMKKKFDKPVLMLLGRQDSRAGYKDAWNIMDNYPRATFAVLDGAGHNLQIEKEDLFNAMVNEWIARVEKC